MLMHVITNFTARAGAETMLTRLLSIAEDKRIVVVSLMGISDRNRELSNNPNVTFIALGATSAFQLGRSAFKLAKIIKREKPDVILCWMYHAMAIGALAKKIARWRGDLVWTIRQSLDDVASLSRSTRIALKACRALSKSADGAIYNSSRAEHLHREYGFAIERSTFIPNGFAMPEIAAPEPRAAQVFGIAGRFHAQKDHETFFAAAAFARKACSDLKFVTAGDGVEAENPAVEALIAKAGLPAECLDLRGEVSDMAAFYQGIDVLVLSSRTEGFPNVVAEAMSYGKPVVTTDVGDAASIVGDCGRVVQSRDAEALGDAIVDVAQLPADAYAELSRSARQRIEDRYALAAIAKQYDDFLGGSV